MLAPVGRKNYAAGEAGEHQRWFRKFGQRDKWSYCLMAGTLCPLDQERP